MTRHDLLLLFLGALLVLLALASVELAAEIRWRRRTRRQAAAEVDTRKAEA
ncbi:hypothetical protein [Streptomyces sp. RPT161]|uniref:hypothetical protein n=1 Tax=Streptomyces sp. RPT161 TaxID=3015993 RepID=UPI0022B89D53|nr:hypothetical protein [Streptomyces sp. RPT161]